MKAHLRGTAAPLVLLYGLPEASPMCTNVHAAASKLGMAVRHLAPSALDDTVGSLADAVGDGVLATAPAALTSQVIAATALSTANSAIRTAETPPTQAATPLLLMANFSTDAINALLNALRAQNTPPILKAVVTKHNKSWTVRALLQELLREKEEMEGANA